MAGMKIRLARTGSFASTRTKGFALAALLLFLASAVPRIGYSQDKSGSAGAPQKPAPASLPKSSGGNAAKAIPGGNTDGLDAGAITDIRIAPEETRLIVTVATDRMLAPQEFLVEKPARLVLDFPNTYNRAPLAQLPIHALSVKQLRVQQFRSVPSPIARVVLDLEEDYGTHEIETKRDAVRLIFHRGKSSFADVASSSGAKASAPAGISKPNTSTISHSNHLMESEAKPFRPSDAALKSPAPQGAALNAAASKPVATPASTRTDLPNRVPEKISKSSVSETAAPGISSIVSELKPAVSKPEPPRAATAADPKPVASPTQAPLVAAMTSSTVAPTRMITPTRFSGQPLTLDLVEMPLVDFFRLMSEEGGINVVMDPEIKGRVNIKVVKVPWDQIFESVLSNNGLDKQVEGTVVRIARKATLQDEARQQESLKKANLLAADLETRIKRLNYAKATALVKALEDQKTVRGTIVVEERTNSLIVTDLPDSIDKLNGLIEQLDVPQPQVEIEARIVSATRDFARDIGIQFGFVDGNLQRVTVGGPNTFGTIGGTRPSATPTSTYSAGNSGTGRGSAASSATESAGTSTGTSSTNAGNWNVNLAAAKAFGGIGVSIGNIFDTFLLDAAITAGESKGLAKLISQPKVTAQNNTPAVITQGLRFPVQIIANNTITVQFQNAALTLTVTPQITYEGNIVLDLKVENNTPDFSRQVNGIPSIRTSESTTKVQVTDGGTTVIGGILIDDEATQEDKVPGLGSLPLVGNLFRRTSVSRSTQEVLFFVTPRVIK
jgi:type IV pilus secretin PilQ/predicted competence protein